MPRWSCSTAGRRRLIDVALKYGYESPVSFARAFHALHGITSAMARQEGIALKAYPRLSFLITIKGAEAMNYRIETLCKRFYTEWLPTAGYEQVGGIEFENVRR